MKLINYTPTTKCGGGAILDSLCRVGRSVRPSVCNSCPMCQLKVKVTVKGQIFNKQIFDIMSCPLYKPNRRISFKLE